MGSLLSAEEIEALLIHCTNPDPGWSYFESVREFETFLTGLEFAFPGCNSSCSENISIIHFFSDPLGEILLDKIIEKNKTENMGIIEVPGTRIEVINYSYCKSCKAVFRLDDLIKHYSDPLSRDDEFSRPPRVGCNTCHKGLIPILIINDRIPFYEFTQMMRLQTIHAIEDYCK
ncbi:MAG: hypothetical protein HQM09_17635 [Candidatus Riflebacteria bacterium]|nr:hypothetical protein [Candidatus Riflebacteria bacterium]